MPEPLRASGIRAVFDRALELEREGRSIVHLEIGRPHLGSPPAAVEAAREALAAGDVHYTANRGRPELREALAARLDARGVCGVEVVVTAGGSEAVAATFQGLLAPGDEVIVLDPAWPHYDPLVRLAGGVPVHVPCDAADGFQPDIERVAAAVTDRTRMLVVSSPSNPTGAVLDAERLEALAELCRQHDLIALSDEIYASFTYGDADHCSIATFDGMGERTVIADSASKTWAMTGWRIGWVAAPPSLIDPIATVHQYIAVCAPSFAQAGLLAALQDGDDFVEAMVAEYAERSADVRRAFENTPVEVPTLDGAFYAFPRIPGGDPDFALQLLETAGVAVVPGRVFGEAYADHLRLSYGVSAEELAEGLRRITDAL